MHKADKKSLPSHSVHSFGGWVIDKVNKLYSRLEGGECCGETHGQMRGTFFLFSCWPCSLPLFSSSYFFFLLAFCLPPPPKSSPPLIPSNPSLLTPALRAHPSLPSSLDSGFSSSCSGKSPFSSRCIVAPELRHIPGAAHPALGAGEAGMHCRNSASERKSS